MLNILKYKNIKITGIMAIDLDGLIGIRTDSHDTLPWDCPDEKQFFKNTINNQPMIMGMKTYNSSPKWVQNQQNNIILSRNIFIENMNKNDAIILNDIKNIHQYLIKPQYFMIGGAEVCKLMLEYNLVDSFLLTIMKKKYIGNVYMDIKYFNDKEKKKIMSHFDFDVYEILI